MRDQIYQRIVKENTTLISRVRMRLGQLGWRVTGILLFLVIAVVVLITVTELTRRIAPYFDAL